MNFRRGAIFSLFLLAALSNSALGADWPPISAEDRAMASVQGQPGAPAVILAREETDDNMNNLLTVYERIKILTEKGLEYTTVDIPSNRQFSVATLSGRTVHADGSVSAFAGKAFDKKVSGAGGITIKAFTLPDVQVGSIIDFRYSLRFLDNRVFPPEWEVQTDLYQVKAYFKFIPLQNRGYASVQLDHGQLARKLAWTPFLGNGAQPMMHTLPANTFATVHDVLLWVDLRMKDVPPLVEEPFMPPASLLQWRVFFYYQATLKPEDYWRDERKFWNKDVEAFIAKNDGLGGALAKAMSPTDTAEQKVHKIYAFVSSLRHDSGTLTLAKPKAYALEYRSPECIMESGVTGLAASGVSGCVQTQSSPVDKRRQTSGVDDVLTHGGGSHNELNRLFVAMLRAAGVSASLIWVTDRSQQAFLKDYLSTDQLDGEIAIVPLEGKDVFLDPGTRFCPYGMIDWRYSAAMGLRQTAKGGDIGETPPLDYRQSLTTRKADLSLDRNGVLAGVVSLVFKGVPAMILRQAGENSDREQRNQILDGQLTGVLRGKTEAQLVNSPDWDKADNPLVAQFHIRVQLPMGASQQVSLAELFQAGEKSRFPAPQRSNPVDFRYPWQEADEIRVVVPRGTELVKLALGDSLGLGYARYRVLQKQEAADTVYARRDFIMGTALISPDKYKELKDFFDRIKADDDQPTSMKLSSSMASSN